MKLTTTPRTWNRTYKQDNQENIHTDIHTYTSIQNRGKVPHLHCKMAMAASKLSKIYTTDISTAKPFQELEV
jgi:hypothetical protein